jgi:hypothetical protein
MAKTKKAPEPEVIPERKEIPDYLWASFRINLNAHPDMAREIIQNFCLCCVFRQFPDTDFGNSRTAISVIPGQRFR